MAFVAFPWLVERLPDLHKSRKTPVAFSFVESVIRRMRAKYRGIPRIPQHQRKLHAGIPVFRRLPFESMLKVERRTLHLISKREEEDPPGMASTLEYRTLFSSCQLSPSLNMP